jgi:putative transposase
MGRIARVVVPGCWHHVTQRGNHQQTVFFDDSDREFYRSLLHRHATQHGVRITGYCLMGNHVHLLAVPEDDTGLAYALGRAHLDYSRWLNMRRQETGHLWQSRFYSCPLDEAHQWEALRYVELNPVRAGMAARAADWRWSSAHAHLTGRDDTGLVDCTDWEARWSAHSWGDVLDHGVDDADLLARIRESTRTGRPAATDDSLKRIEASIGRPLHPRKRGPKPISGTGYITSKLSRPNFEVM